MNWFDIFFCDDGGKEYRNSIRAASPCDARSQADTFFVGLRGTGKILQIADGDSGGYSGEAMPFQVGRGDIQDGDAA